VFSGFTTPWRFAICGRGQCARESATERRSHCGIAARGAMASDTAARCSAGAPGPPARSGSGARVAPPRLRAGGCVALRRRCCAICLAKRHAHAAEAPRGCAGAAAAPGPRRTRGGGAAASAMEASGSGRVPDQPGARPSWCTPPRTAWCVRPRRWSRWWACRPPWPQPASARASVSFRRLPWALPRPAASTAPPSWWCRGRCQPPSRRAPPGERRRRARAAQRRARALAQRPAHGGRPGGRGERSSASCGRFGQPPSG